MKKFLLLAFLGIAVGSLAQSVTIRSVALAGNKIVVNYDLDDSNSSNEYLLNLYASRDNYASPLTKVTGDIGPEVKPGVGKKVEWNIVEEYGAYRGRISLELKGKVFVLFVKIKDFDATKSYKRGKQYDITWRPGGANPVSIELYKGNQRLQGDMNLPNNGTYTLNIPSSAKTGKDYRLRFSDAKNNENVILTPFFKVAAKIPLLVKVLPVVALGGAAAALGGGGKGGGGGGGTTGTSIMDPPLPANP